MRTLALLFAVSSALAAPVLASAQTQIIESRFDRAPWWMDQPVIASTGYVEKEFQANRANFTASFLVVERTAEEATKVAADRVRALGLALVQPGADKVRVETNFSIRPIYEQYRDKDGNRIDNQRADKIERYEVNAVLSVEVRDLGLLERAYAAVMATRPNSTSRVSFSLEATNEAKTDLFRAAVADANRRAKLATEVSGARLGAVKLIDPTGRACQTDVLVAGAPRSYGPGVDSQYEETVVTGRAAAALPPMPLPSSRSVSAADIMSGQPLPADQAPLPLQPPLRKLQSEACVVYALGG